MLILSGREAKIQRLYYLLIAMSILGNIMLWFEADFIRNHLGAAAKSFGGSGVSIFATAGLCTMFFYLSTVPNYFIPSSHRGALRKFAAVLFANGADTSICLCHSYFSLAVGTATQGELAKTGSCLVLISSFAAFLIAFTVPKQPLRDTIPRMLSVRGVSAILCVLCLVCGQASIWGMQTCGGTELATNRVYIHNVTPMLFAILILSSNVECDKGTQDMGYFFMVHYLVAVPPVFSSHLHELAAAVNIPHLQLLAKLTLGFLFAGACFLVFPLLVSRYFESRRRSVITQPPITNYEVLGQIALGVVSLGSAVCVWVKVWDVPQNLASGEPEGTAYGQYYQTLLCYYAALSLTIPLANFWGTVKDYKLATTYAALLSFNLSPALAALFIDEATPQTPLLVTSYIRSSFVLLLLVQIVSPCLVYVRMMNQPVDSYFATDMPLPSRSPRTRRRATPMMVFWLWLLDAAYCWAGNTTILADTPLAHVPYPSILMIGLFTYLSQSDNDIQRVVYFALLFDVTNPALWPISPFISKPVGFDHFLLLVNGLWFVTIYSWDTPAANFDGLHEEYLSSTFINDEEEKSKGLLEGGLSNKSYSPERSPQTGRSARSERDGTSMRSAAGLLQPSPEPEVPQPGSGGNDVEVGEGTSLLGGSKRSQPAHGEII